MAPFAFFAEAIWVTDQELRRATFPQNFRLFGHLLVVLLALAASSNGKSGLNNDDLDGR